MENINTSTVNIYFDGKSPCTTPEKKDKIQKFQLQPQQASPVSIGSSTSPITSIGSSFVIYFLFLIWFGFHNLCLIDFSDHPTEKNVTFFI